MDDYQKRLAERAKLLGEVENSSEDSSGDPEEMGEKVPTTVGLNTPPEAAPNANTGKVSQAGDVVAAGGVAGGNPYVAGAGLALSTLGKVDDAKRATEQAKIDAYNRKIMAQRAAIRNFFS